MLLRTASSALLVLLVACGGGSNPPLTPDTHDSGAESFGEVNPADLAELDAGGGGGGAATKSPEPSATTASAAPPAAPEPKDECTPVGVDFEKRARPKMKECYATAKKKDPNLQGTVKITLDLDMTGKVKTVKILEKTLPESVAQCMLKVVKTTPLPDGSKCPGKSFTIPMTFPTPK